MTTNADPAWRQVLFQGQLQRSPNSNIALPVAAKSHSHFSNCLSSLPVTSS